MKSLKIILFLFVLALMAMTNPSKSDYVSWLNEKAMAQSNGLEKGLVVLMGKTVFESATTVNDYVFFSVFTTETNGSFKVIGVFHNFIPIKESSKINKPPARAGGFNYTYHYRSFS